MTARPLVDQRLTGRILGFVLLASVWPAAPAWGQSGPTPEPPPPAKLALAEEPTPAPPAPAPIHDPNVVQTGCSTCSGGLLSAAAPPVNGYDTPPTGGCSTCGGGCGGPGCIPGRKSCYCDCCKDCDTCVGRMLCGIYDCICCPDPCYEPHWCAVADSAFFVESARPVTQLRLRIDNGFDVPTPDRAEFFWARERTMPNQAEPGPSDPKDPAFNCFKHGVGKGPTCIASHIDHEDISLYMEGGTETFSFFIETPYREVDPTTAPDSFMPVMQQAMKGPATNMVPSNDLINKPLAPNTPLPHDVKLGPPGMTVNPPQNSPAPSNTPNPAGAQVTPAPGTTGTTPSDTKFFPLGTTLTKGTTFPGTLTIFPGATKPVPAMQKIKEQLVPCCNVSGFADMNLGTKSVLLDCELLLLTFQFKTYLPTGNFITGLGTGHVSLEPSLLFTLKLTPDCYLQGQYAYWIPVGGDALYEGDIFHQHYSLNKTLWCPCPGLRLVGTLECEHWQVLGGDFTSPTLLVVKQQQVADGKGGMKNVPALAPVAQSATTGMFSAGPGLRFFICDKLDVGVGTQIAVTEDHWEEELVRFDFRWRF
jgi:hypothetical protein